MVHARTARYYSYDHSCIGLSCSTPVSTGTLSIGWRREAPDVLAVRNTLDHYSTGTYSTGTYAPGRLPGTVRVPVLYQVNEEEETNDDELFCAREWRRLYVYYS